jgi:hypothetical protein
MESTTSDISIYERKILTDTVKQHSKEFELMASMLNIYINGFNLIGNYTLEENEANWVLLLLITRSFHSLRCSIELMKKGYYAQAMALIRMVTENYFICGNCKNDKTIVDAIIHNKPNRPNGKTKFDFKTLATNMGSSFFYENHYAFECEFGHCSALSVRILTENGELKVIPSYNELLFMACCEMLFRNSILMAKFLEDFLNELSAEKVNVWRQTVGNGSNEIVTWLDNLKQKRDSES